MMKKPMNSGPMLNAYPDSMGGTLHDIVAFLQQPDAANAFASFYILPSVFHTDLDRGFSVIDYGLNQMLASRADLQALQDLHIDLKLDFILNHASVLSAQFQDILEKGEASPYKDFFINWNEFWQGKGTLTPDGYVQPDATLIEKMFFRKPGLPILMVRFPDGKEVPYWNTFYQEVRYPVLDAQDVMKATGLQYSSAAAIAQKFNAQIAAGARPCDVESSAADTVKAAVVELLESRRKYLGQMDLNIKSPLVWEFYENTLKTLAGYGASIVRLDAFAYASKIPGAPNFLNDPGTWDLLEQIKTLADRYGLTLLPEIHASYGEKTYALLAQKGYMTYDFFLPGLLIYAFERADATLLQTWANEQVQQGIRTVNMLGCHDGIPLLDLKGFLPETEIEALINTVVARGGYVKNLHGQKNVYYQVNATYYSALGESDARMLLARAVQLFMPGKPQIWYLDLFAGKNDHEAVEKAGAGGHKEINRTNLSAQQLAENLNRPVVTQQLQMLTWRNSFPAFGFDATMEFTVTDKKSMQITWKQHDCTARLTADLAAYAFKMEGIGANGETVFALEQEGV